MSPSHQPLPQEDADDVERQTLEIKDAPVLTETAVEDTISARSKLTQLGFYFLCNVSLTIYNKLILGKFPYPWLLTALHAGSASIGCYALRMRGTVPRTRLEMPDELKLAALSVLFTINIAISNVSLEMVSVPFHQIVRSTTPVVTIFIYRVLYGRTYSRETYLSLIPIVVGVAMTCYGEFYFTLTGFLLTNLGVVLAAAKTIATNRIMTGTLKLSPLETLLRMSPLAFGQALFISWASGELGRAMAGAAAFMTAARVATEAATAAAAAAAGALETGTTAPAASAASAAADAGVSPLGMAIALLGNGMLAFALNVSSFTANKAAGALTMTVCGNVKQCLTVLLGIMLFNVTVGFTNGLGMVVSLAGAAWYSVVELQTKKARPSPPK